MGSWREQQNWEARLRDLTSQHWKLDDCFTHKLTRLKPSHSLRSSQCTEDDESPLSFIADTAALASLCVCVSLQGIETCTLIGLQAAKTPHFG